jgi:hypothetical protein
LRNSFFLEYTVQTNKSHRTVPEVTNDTSQRHEFCDLHLFYRSCKIGTSIQDLGAATKRKSRVDGNVALNNQPLQITQAQALFKSPNAEMENVDFTARQKVSAT